MFEQKNPFGIKTLIRDEKKFFGRKKEINKIRSLLAENQPCSIIGPRRIGKSSLLYYFSNSKVIERLNLPYGKTIYIDCLIIVNTEGFLKNILKNIKTDKSVHISSDKDDLFESVQNRFEEQARNSQPFLLLLDEIEKLKGKEFSELLLWVRALTSSQTINFMSVSKSHLIDVFSDSDDLLSSPLWNILTEVPLGLMEENEVVNMLKIASSEFSEITKEIIINEAGCHPFFIHQLANHCYKIWIKNKEITQNDFDKALESFRREVNPNFRYMMNELSHETRNWLLENYDKKTLSLDLSHASRRVREELTVRACITTEKGEIFSQSFALFIEDYKESQEKAEGKDISGSLKTEEIEGSPKITEKGQHILKYLFTSQQATEPGISFDLRLLPFETKKELQKLLGLNLVVKVKKGESNILGVDIPVYKLTSRGESWIVEK